MTYMLLLNCALKLVEEIILYYDARSKKHKKMEQLVFLTFRSFFQVKMSVDHEPKKLRIGRIILSK